MSEYTPSFTKPYPSGWKNKPDTSTPWTAEIQNNYEGVIENIENYLEDNPIGGEKLEDLLDININNPSDGEILKFNGATEKWENSTGGGGSAEIAYGTQADFDEEQSDLPVGASYYITDDDEYMEGEEIYPSTSDPVFIGKFGAHNVYRKRFVVNTSTKLDWSLLATLPENSEILSMSGLFFGMFNGNRIIGFLGGITYLTVWGNDWINELQIQGNNVMYYVGNQINSMSVNIDYYVDEEQEVLP